MLCIDIMAILSIFLRFYCELYYTTTAIQLVVITRKHLLQVFMHMGCCSFNVRRLLFLRRSVLI